MNPDDRNSLDEPRAEREAVDRSRTPDATGDGDSFLDRSELTTYQDRWRDLQASFIDDPRTAVTRAHALVGDLVNSLQETFTRERTGLEGQWNRNETDTEALRLALQRYRAFFNRLLST